MFLLFTFSEDAPRGGAADFEKSFDCLEKAIEHASDWKLSVVQDRFLKECWHIFDTETKTVVASGHNLDNKNRFGKPFIHRAA